MGYSEAGKGDAPRNCFSQQYRDRHGEINWPKKQNTNIIDEMNTPPVNFTELADTIAREKHKDQTRNDKKTLYYTHPLAVERIAIDIATKYANHLPDTYFEYIRQIAKLHDTVEDTNLTIADIKNYGFADYVVEGVAAITKNPVKGNESYLDYLNRVLTNQGAHIVKIADLEHNMSDLKPGNMLDKYVLAHHYLMEALRK